MKITRRRRSDSGTQLIELGLVMPMLLLLSLGVIDMARLLQASQVVSNAAREGARLAELPENQGNNASVISHVQYYITTENNIACNGTPTVTITINNATLPNGDVIRMSTVHAQCNYTAKYLPSLMPGAFPATVNLGGWANFRNF